MKCYVIEVGAYSDRYIDAVFTTRELAEAYIEHQKRAAYDRHMTSVVIDRERRAPFEAMGVAWHGPADVDVSYAEFVARYVGSEFGYVEEYDLWDVLPVVEEPATV